MDSAIALRRLRLISVSGRGLAPRRQVAWLAELAKLGFRVRNPEVLAWRRPDVVRHRELIEELRALRGGDVPYVPLFRGFPDDVPEETSYLVRRVVGYLGNLFEQFEEGVELENGVRVPRWLFDLTQFGADPITQMQTLELFEEGRADQEQRAADEHVEWLDLELVEESERDERLLAWLRDVLYAKSSIKQALHDDVHALLAGYGVGVVDPDRIGQKETRALVLRASWQTGNHDAVQLLADTPTDLLRLFAALTDSDVSLGEPIRFPKMGRPQRKAVLGVLEEATSLAEDLNRYRGLWLALGRYLHPGEHRARFPRAAEAFRQLARGRIPTFASRTEALVAGGDLQRLLTHLGGRPGVLARKVHELLRRFSGERDVVLDALEAAVPAIPSKTLLVMRSHFGSINEAERRVVINKRGKVIVLDNPTRGALSSGDLARLAAILKGALLARFADKPAWSGPVWVAPGLERYTVPLQQRSASDGLIAIGRGSRIPVTFDTVLRLFVYWKQARRTTDLDLSVIQFDADWTYVGHVSYTQLAAAGIRHSGDLQSAPHGAAEFMDITLTEVDPKVRFLATQVHRYSGETFDQLQVHAGWMWRRDVNADVASFDIKTVANKFDLTGANAYSLPLVVDLQEREIVWTDLAMAGRTFHSNVEGSHHNAARACREIARFSSTRPTLDGLAQLHLEARGGRRVADRGDAAVTIGFGPEHTVDVGNVERILNELL